MFDKPFSVRIRGVVWVERVIVFAVVEDVGSEEVTGSDVWILDQIQHDRVEGTCWECAGAF